MYQAAEGRYLTRAEQAMLRDYAAQLETRLAAMEEIQSKETLIVEQTLKQVMDAYPDYEQRHKEARAKGMRDMCLVLRYATQAMVRNDLQYLDDALLTWFRTILKGVGFTGNFIEDAYKLLGRQASRELTPETAALIAPYLGQCVATLGGKRA
jgi:hypothetical protein